MTNSITSSVRLYKENFGDELNSLLDRVPTLVSTGCAKFRFEGSTHLDWALKDKFLNLIHTAHYEDGGHFVAKQFPGQLYNDFISFVEKNERFNVV